MATRTMAVRPDGRAKHLFWLALAAAALGAAATAANFAWPRGTEFVPITYEVRAADIPAPGDPPKLIESGRFYLVHLTREDAEREIAVANAILPRADPAYAPDLSELAGISPRIGLLAIPVDCYHDGSQLVWRPEVDQSPQSTSLGAFECHDRAAYFTMTGIRFRGPWGPRLALSTLPVTPSFNGSIIVTTNRPREGSLYNVTRARRLP